MNRIDGSLTMSLTRFLAVAALVLLVHTAVAPTVRSDDSAAKTDPSVRVEPFPLTESGEKTDPATKPATGAPSGAKDAQAKKKSDSATQALVPTTNLFAMMKEGGALMWPLAVCSVVGLGFVFERLISLRRSRVIPKAFVTRFLQQVSDGDLDRESATVLCQESASPVATIFAAAVRKWGRPGVEVEQAIIDAGERATNGLRSYMRIFTALAVIAPLVGLLGTVFGMIEAFNAVASTNALGRPELLAKGISRALLNTAFGLTLAIPAQSFYLYLVSRVDRLIIDMDALGEQLVNLISAEEILAREEHAAKGRRTKREPAS